MKFNYIDIENWSRKPYYDHFINKVKCSYSITTNIDITDLLRTSKSKKIKLYPVLIYILSIAVNKHKEFRTCFDKNGDLGYWDELNPSYTIFNKDSETFSNIWTEFDQDFSSFYENYCKDIEQYGNAKELSPKQSNLDNTFNISSVPWINFSSFNLNIYDASSYLLPIFTFGKYSKVNDTILIPLSLQVHHAVCDGFHVSKLVNEVQELAFNYNEYL